MKLKRPTLKQEVDAGYAAFLKRRGLAPMPLKEQLKQMSKSAAVRARQTIV